MVKNWDDRYVRLLGKVSKNKTTEYLLPVINCDKGFISHETLVEFGFVNAYIKWPDCSQNHKDCLYLLFNPSLKRLNDWREFYDSYCIESGYIQDWDIDIGLIVIAFRIKPEFVKFPEYLLKGQYGKMDIKNYAQNFVVSQSNNKIKALKQYFVITKSSKYRKELEEEIGEELPINAELGSIPNLEEEILDIDKLKALYK